MTLMEIQSDLKFSLEYMCRVLNLQIQIAKPVLIIISIYKLATKIVKKRIPSQALGRAFLFVLANGYLTF